MTRWAQGCLRQFSKASDTVSKCRRKRVGDVVLRRIACLSYARPWLNSQIYTDEINLNVYFFILWIWKGNRTSDCKFSLDQESFFKNKAKMARPICLSQKICKFHFPKTLWFQIAYTQPLLWSLVLFASLSLLYMNLEICSPTNLISC